MSSFLPHPIHNFRLGRESRPRKGYSSFCRCVCMCVCCVLKNSWKVVMAEMMAAECLQAKCLIYDVVLPLLGLSEIIFLRETILIGNSTNFLRLRFCSDPTEVHFSRVSSSRAYPHVKSATRLSDRETVRTGN